MYEGCKLKPYLHRVRCRQGRRTMHISPSKQILQSTFSWKKHEQWKENIYKQSPKMCVPRRFCWKHLHSPTAWTATQIHDLHGNFINWNVLQTKYQMARRHNMYIWTIQINDDAGAFNHFTFQKHANQDQSRTCQQAENWAGSNSFQCSCRSKSFHLDKHLKRTEACLRWFKGYMTWNILERDGQNNDRCPGWIIDLFRSCVSASLFSVLNSVS